MAGAWGAWGCFAGALGGPLEVSGGPLGDFEIVKKLLFFLHFEALTSPKDAKGGKMPDSKASQEYTWPRKSP